MKVKTQYLNSRITRGKFTLDTSQSTINYQYYISIGFGDIFEEEKEVNPLEFTLPKKKKNEK